MNSLLPGIQHDPVLKPPQEGSPHVVVDERDVISSDMISGALSPSPEGSNSHLMNVHQPVSLIFHAINKCTSYLNFP